MSGRRTIREAVCVLERAARELDADGLRGPEAAELFEDVARARRACGVLESLLAARVDVTGSFRSSGHQSAADWVAAKTGSTFTAAQNTLAIGASLDDLPEIAEAYRSGELSEAQAKIVVDTARRVPDAAGEMVAAAKRPGTLKGLRDKATRIKCAAEPDDAAWAALDAKIEEIFHEARRTRPSAERGSRMAYAVDALVTLCEGERPAKVAPLQVIIDRGTAELRSVGPIPLATTVALMSGGGPGAAARKSRRRASRPGSETRPSVSEGAGLDAREAPERRTRSPGADHREDSNVIPLSEGGTTTRDNLWRLCPWHHDRKTYDRWRVTGPVHAWNLVPPEVSDGPDP